MHRILCLEKKIKDFKVLQKFMEGVADRFDLVRFDSTMKVLSYLVDNAADAVFLTKDSEEMDTEILVNILRKIDSNLRVVLVSNSKADAYKVMQLELDGFLLKPVTEENVDNMLLGLCDKLCFVEAKKAKKAKSIA